MTKKKTIVILIVVSVAVFMGAGVMCAVLFTPAGSRLATQAIMNYFAGAGEAVIGESGGSLAQGQSFHNIELTDLSGLPVGSVMKIQQLDIGFSSLRLDGLVVEIFNGRLRLPDSEPILFYGTFKENTLAISAYSKNVNVRHMLDLFVSSQEVKKISGTIKDFDIVVSGTLLEPDLAGTFFVEKLTSNGFSMHQCPGSLQLSLKDIKTSLKLFGEVMLKSGILIGPRTAQVKLLPSMIIFSGAPEEPFFDAQATAIVEKTKIKIVLKGTADEPDLQLSSEPSLPREQLLLMVATNRSWGVTEALFKQKGGVPTELAKDFVDYFLFSGSGSQMAEQFGISGVSFTFDGSKRGVGITKSLSDTAEANYGIEQSQETAEKTSSTTHTFGGEIAVTETISVGAEKEITQTTDENDRARSTIQSNDKVLLKYKKQF
ncbi:translocation/assembly module TamB domain-containing protein [Candidatus Omnitrophota bacterium]